MIKEEINQMGFITVDTPEPGKISQYFIAPQQINNIKIGGHESVMTLYNPEAGNFAVRVSTAEESESDPAFGTHIREAIQIIKEMWSNRK